MNVEKESRGYDWKEGQRATYKGCDKQNEDIFGKAGKVIKITERAGMTPLVTVQFPTDMVTVPGGSLHRSCSDKRRERREKKRAEQKPKKKKGAGKRSRKKHRKDVEKKAKEKAKPVDKDMLSRKTMKKLKAVHDAIVAARNGAPVPFAGNVDGALTDEECSVIDVGLKEYLSICRGALERRGITIMTPLDVMWPAVDALEHAAQAATKKKGDTGAYALTFLANRLDDSSSILERWFRMDKQEPDKMRLGGELRRRGLIQ